MGLARRRPLNTPLASHILLTVTKYFPTESQCSFIYNLSSEHRYISTRNIYLYFFLKNQWKIKHRERFPHCSKQLLGEASVTKVVVQNTSKQLRGFPYCMEYSRLSQIFKKQKLGMVTHTYDVRSWEAEPGESGIQGHPTQVTQQSHTKPHL